MPLQLCVPYCWLQTVLGNRFVGTILSSYRVRVHILVSLDSFDITAFYLASICVYIDHRDISLAVAQYHRSSQTDTRDQLLLQ